MKRVLELLPKSKYDLGRNQRSKLKASIEVAVDIFKIKRGIYFYNPIFNYHFNNDN